MERSLIAFILGISLIITVPITIGLFAVKDSMEDISFSEVSNGMNGITGNLENINHVLNTITKEDILLIKNVFILMNQTLTNSISLTPNIGINIEDPGANLNNQETLFNDRVVSDSENLRRI